MAEPSRYGTGRIPPRLEDADPRLQALEAAAIEARRAAASEEAYREAWITAAEPVERRSNSRAQQPG